jgi:hypothetical protein
MEIGAVLLILAVILLVSIFISRPFFDTKPSLVLSEGPTKDELEHKRSSLLAEYDQTLSAIQELEFDQTLGKIPAEEFPPQRTMLLQTAVELLRQIDAFQEKEPLTAIEDRIEAAIQSRRVAASAMAIASPNSVPLPNLHEDEALETLIAVRRGSHQAKAGGFCPRCGKPVQKNDRFCPKCGAPC